MPSHHFAPKRVPTAAPRGFWELVIRPRGTQGISEGDAKKVPQPAYRVGLLSREQMAVRIHRQRDRRMTHHCLDNLGVGAGH